MSSEQFRVLHIITHLESAGGAQEYAILSVLGLDKLPEYQVDLLSGRNKGDKGELLLLAQKKTNLILVSEMRRGINPFLDLMALWKLYRIIKKGRYHIVHTHISKAGVLGRIAARLAKTPIVIHTLHGLLFHDSQTWLVNRLGRTVKKICEPLTDHFISVSKIISEKAVAAGIGTPEKFTTVYSGMELDWFINGEFDAAEIRRKLGIPENCLVIGKIARLVSAKGHKYLLDAAPEIISRFPNVRFLLLGDGVLNEHLQKRVEQCGMSKNFIFAGLVERKKIPKILSIMDIVVHTSVKEGLARILPQSLAMGKPCVSYNIDGAPEVIINNKTGFLVEINDKAGLIEAISNLIESPDLRKRMGENGRQLVDPQFRTETMVRDIAKVYKMLLSRHKLV